MRRDSCFDCSKTLGQHAFVSVDGKRLLCGRCFTGYRPRRGGMTPFEKLADDYND